MQRPAWIVRAAPEVRPYTWARHVPAPPSAPSPEPLVDAIDPARVDALERAVVEAEGAAARAASEAARANAEVAALRERESVLAAEVDAARAALATFEAKVLGDAERELVRLAAALAERVVGRELAIDPSLVVAWAREALAESSFGEALAIAVSPDVAAQIGNDAWGELAPRVLVDASLPEATSELRDGAVALRSSAQTRLDLVVEHVAAEVDREAA
ncbi:MAG: hypothetical protein KF819_07060 [Labilithrix sp.]|nr:hypothetical protein [Labilithrix sp.]